MLKQIIDIIELLDDPAAGGAKAAALLKARCGLELAVKRIKGAKGSTDFVRTLIPGTHGRGAGGSAPTLGIIGRLGGIGARPERIGIVSDADGAVAALACALKLGEMAVKGDRLPGDVIVATHICPDAPTQAHEPVPFMGSPVDMPAMNAQEVDPVMDAILSIDTTRGNRVINHRGFAITPTIKAGWVLKVSEDLLDIMEWSTGDVPRVLPVSMQDITPYGNGVFHINSILQPCTATDAPVVGVALTGVRPVPGCGTGASQEIDIEAAARYCLEVAKAFGAGKCHFFDAEEFARLEKLYGPMKALQTLGKV
jgi:hypothetical protein